MTVPKVAVLVFALTASSALAEPPRQLDESIQKKGSTGASPEPACTFSAGTRTDIYGTGIDRGTVQGSLASCQAHCSATSSCQSAQFSAGTQTFNGKNCFIYDSHNDNYPIAADIDQFLLYKCTRQQSPTCVGYWCGPYYQDIYGTGIDGGMYTWSFADCQDHCANTANCKAAQYSDNEQYNGNNCFIYDNQNPTEGQLKDFKLWYYQGHNAAWGNGLDRDIDGVGLGGSWATNLATCKDRCVQTQACRAAQWSATSQYKGYNCYIYATDVENKPQFMDFKLYKYRRAGCAYGQWMCSRLYSDDAIHWVEHGKENSIANLALPVFLPIAAVVGIVGAIGIARRVRASQRTVAASSPEEEMEALQ